MFGLHFDQYGFPASLLPFGKSRGVLRLSFLLKVPGPRQVIGVIKTTKTDFEEDQQETSPEFLTTKTYHSIQQWQWIQAFLASKRKLSAT